MTLLQSPIECYKTGDMLACALADLVGAAGGEAQFGFLVGSVLITSFWLAGSGDIATPAVVTTIIGSLLFPLLSPTFSGIAQTIAFIGLVGAVFSIGRKFIIEGQQ